MDCPLINVTNDELKRLFSGRTVAELAWSDCIYNGDMSIGVILIKGKPLVAIGQVDFKTFYDLNNRLRELLQEVQDDGKRFVLGQLRHTMDELAP